MRANDSITRCDTCGSLISTRSLDEEIGQRVRAVRIARGLSQAQLAAAIYATASVISNWETGYATIPCDRVREIAGALDIPVGWLTEDTGKPIKG